MLEILLFEPDIERRNKLINDFNDYSHLDQDSFVYNIINEEDIRSNDEYLFADIAMIDISSLPEEGYAFCERFRIMNPDALLILIHNNDDYALDGYRISLNYYLTSNLNQNDVYSCFDHCKYLLTKIFTRSLCVTSNILS